MGELVSSIGQNQPRSVMLIFGRTLGTASAGVYIYESEELCGNREIITVGMAQLHLESPVV